MKYCKICKENFDTEKNSCPICGVTLIDIPNDEGDAVNEYEAAEIVSAMMITGIL